MTDAPPTITGVIYPPPELRVIVDRSASFVARNGRQFEERIKKAEQGDVRFKFLDTDNPYHTYYLSKVEEFKAKLSEGADTAPEDEEAKKKKEEREHQRRQNALLSKKRKAKQNPCPKAYSVAVDPGVSSLELETVKLTAQYVALHGKSFGVQLLRSDMGTEFDFLKETHPRHDLYDRLVRAYTLIATPPPGFEQQLQEDLDSSTVTILQQAQDAADWRAEEEKRKKQAEAAADQDRSVYHSIDWQDFVVVETIDYPAGPAPQSGAVPPPPLQPKAPPPPPPPTQAAEPLPLPPAPPIAPQPPAPAPVPPSIQPEKPAPRGLPSALAPAGPEPTAKPNRGTVTTLTDGDEDIAGQVRPGYVRMESERKRKRHVLDPSGKEISIDEAERHMQITTMSEQFHVQKKMRQADLSSTNLATDEEVSRTVAKFAKKRTDLFGGSGAGAGAAPPGVWDGTDAGRDTAKQAAAAAAPGLRERAEQERAALEAARARTAPEPRPAS